VFAGLAGRLSMLTSTGESFRLWPPLRIVSLVKTAVAV